MVNDFWHLAAVFVVTIIASTLSGIIGGGGSFILTPFYIWLGLTPQQTVATGKFGGLGTALGAIAAFKKRMLENKKLSLLVMAITLVVSLLASYLLQNIQNSHLQLAIGIFMVAMVSVVAMKDRKVSAKKPTLKTKSIGTFLLSILLTLQGLLGSGLGSLTSLIFMYFFGMTPLEANMMKRKTSIILTTVIPLALLTSGLINFRYGFCAIAGGLIGGFIGSHIAIRKGDEFIRLALLVFIAVSGTWLIVTA